MISIHALRKEGDAKYRELFKAIDISIHALRKEGDMFQMMRVLCLWRISIHALRKEGDLS